MSFCDQCSVEVQKIYQHFDASHDYDHILRVLQNARTLMNEINGIDTTVVELAVYLHDIDDPKYREIESLSASEILHKLQVPQDIQQSVITAIESVSFSGGNSKEIASLEGAVVRDADRLDAIGAVGIARAFAYGGAKGRKLYNSEEEVRSTMSEQDYLMKQTATITHFHEKLFLLKNLMVTKPGKRLAEERHEFMKLFVKQLENETGHTL